MLLPVRCSDPRGPLPDGVRVLLLVGTGMLELLGWRAPKSFAWFTHRMSEGEGAGRDFSPGSSSSKTSRCSRDSSESPSSSLAPGSAAGSEIEPAVEAGPVAGRPTRRGIRDLFLFVSSLLEAEGLVGVEVVGVLVE